jgi:hypothetical protein
MWGSRTVGSRVGLLGVPHLSPRYSYSLSCSDSRSCFCLGESGRFQRTRSYFLWCFQAVGHCICICIGSLWEPTVRLTGSDSCLSACGGQAAIVGLEGIAWFPSLIPTHMLNYLSLCLSLSKQIAQSLIWKSLSASIR